jgi:ABC-type antimicrobial peptide transport system permease subunit
VIEDHVRDLRHATRRIWRDRSTSAVIVAVLGLGIGANAAVFGFVRGLLLSEPPYRDPDRLVRIQSVRGDEPGKLSPLEMEDLHEQSSLFEEFAAVRLSQYNLSADGPPEVALASVNTYDLFRLLGVLHRVMASVVQGEHSAAPVVLSITLTLAAAAVLAAWHPVRRALRVDPREALRAE